MPFDLALDLLTCNLTGERFAINEVRLGRFEVVIGRTWWRGWEWN